MTTYFADFETTQLHTATNSVEVYLWALCCGTKISTGYDIKSFVNKVKTLPQKSKIFFHNLKFDNSYLHDYLLKNGEKVEILEKKGQIYSVKALNVEFRDTLNIFPNMSLKQVASVYGDKEYQKGSIEHTAKKGHKATQEEIEYCVMDVLSLQSAYNNYMDNLEEVLEHAEAFKTAGKCRNKLTNAGIAYMALKELTPHFSSIFPQTTKAEFDKYIQAYKGGYVYSKDSKLYNNVGMIDCNSMYPFVYRNKPLPIGKGYECKTYEDTLKYGFSILTLSVNYELKENKVPIIGGGLGRFGNAIYSSSSGGEFREITISNIDFNLIKQFYNIEYRYIEGYGFRTISELFAPYCDTFMSVKNKERGAKRNVAKVLLNSPYGKLAMSGLHDIYAYKIENDILVRDTVGMELDDDAFNYLPAAIAITAYARELLLTTADKIGFENVYYMDTDSIKYNKAVKLDFELDDNLLGAWKDEGTAYYFKTIAPKKYVYWSSGKLSYTCAGFRKEVLSAKMLHNKRVCRRRALKYINKFKNGLTLKVLTSRVVVGGRALISEAKTMK